MSDQTNAPQSSAKPDSSATQLNSAGVQPHPPLAVKVATTTTMVVPPPSPPSLGRSWSLRDVRMAREDMAEAIDKAQSVPDADKAFLKQMVDNLDPKVKLVKVDAHSFASGTNITVTLTAARL